MLDTGFIVITLAKAPRN